MHRRRFHNDFIQSTRRVSELLLGERNYFMMDIQAPEIFVRRMAEWTSTWVGTPSKSNSKIAKISEFWGPERISKYICQLS